MNKVDNRRVIEKSNTFFYFISWGYYFSAGSFAYNKIDNISNECIV